MLAGLATVTVAAAQNAMRVTVPAGTRVLIRMINSVDSSKQQAGYRFTATLETNLQAEDVVVAPRGTTVYGRLASASSAGHMSGSSDLTLELTDIVINGTAYPLLTSTYSVKGKRRRLKNSEKSRWRRRTGRAHRRDSGRRKGSWHRCARRGRCWNGRRRFQEGRATLDTQRISAGVSACTTGNAAG